MTSDVVILVGGGMRKGKSCSIDKYYFPAALVALFVVSNVSSVENVTKISENV